MPGHGGQGRSRRRSKALSIWIALVAWFAWPAVTAHAQVRSDAWTGMHVRAVAVELVPPPEDPAAARKLEVAVRRAFAIWPGRIHDSQSVEFALSRVKSVPGIASASVRIELESTEGVRLVVVARLAPGPSAEPSLADRLKLVDDGVHLLKLRLSLKGALAISKNQWFGNGPVLTQFNPRGQFTGSNGPNLVLDLAPAIGAAGATPLVRGDVPVYLYGSFSYLIASSIGQDNNRDDRRLTSAWEDAFAGVVSGGVTASGSIWILNFSYGMQPYCIGEGMLLCQIASSGGDRAADFAWPRWSGKDFLKAQFRWNDTVFEAFRFTPNDYPSTNTTLAGFNIDHDPGHGLLLGMTGLSVRASDFPYVLPTGEVATRDGLRALHVRIGWSPPSELSAPFVRLDLAGQTSAQLAMRATAGAAAVGWSFGDLVGQPSITLRYSSTSGDDPETPRYERWDFLYSGDDIDTWVQGQLMKNLQYNSNVRVARLMLRAAPTQQWRITGQWSRFRANTRNNLGGVISSFDDEALGHELLALGEHFFSRDVYLRLTGAALWPGEGIERALPSRVAEPWLVGIAQVALQF